MSTINNKIEEWGNTENRLISHIKYEQNEIEILESKFNRNKFKLFGLKPVIYVFILGIWIIFSIATSDNEIEYETALNYIVFKKPNNKSSILYKFRGKSKIEILDKTKYFYKVSLVTEDSLNIEGYMLKENVLH